MQSNIQIIYLGTLALCNAGACYLCTTCQSVVCRQLITSLILVAVSDRAEEACLGASLEPDLSV